jgi:hypothetical protein
LKLDDYGGEFDPSLQFELSTAEMETGLLPSR